MVEMVQMIIPSKKKNFLLLVSRWWINLSSEAKNLVWFFLSYVKGLILQFFFPVSQKGEHFSLILYFFTRHQ